MFSSSIFGALCRLCGVGRGLVISWRDTGYWLDWKHFWALRWACRLSCGLLANSDAVAEASKYVAGNPPKPVRVVCNGVAIPEKVERPAQAVPVIGCLARFTPVKGQDLLLRALALLRDAGVSFRATLGGDGEELSACQALARELALDGLVEFPGEVDDQAGFYRQIDILAVPSRSEGFSNTVLEGMAWGLPLAAFATGGIPEAVRDSVDGFLVPPDDTVAFADALSRLCRDAQLRTRLGANARARATEEFSLARMADETLAALDSFISPAGA